VSYKATRKQALAHQAFMSGGFKRGVMLQGRQSGKTYFANAHGWISSILNQGRYFIVFKTYKQAHEVVWRQYIPLIPKELIYKTNEQDLLIEFHYLENTTITLPNGETTVINHDKNMPRSTLQLLGSDQADCYNDSMEILTDSGWKLFKDLDKTEQVLTLSKDGYAEWQKPVRYIEQDHDGEMYNIKSGRLDLQVTPNHKFYVESGKGVRKFKTISDPTIKGDKIPARAKFKGKDTLTHNDCAIMGFYLAEGSAYGNCGGDYEKRNKSGHEVMFNQVPGIKGGDKGDVRGDFKKILEEEGYNVHEKNQGLYVLNKTLWQSLIPIGNTYTKFIPQEYKEQSPDKLRTLLHWMIMGDGTSRGNHRVYYTVSKRLADDVQEIAIKAGLGARISIKSQTQGYIKGRKINSKAVLYQVSILQNKYSYFSSSRENYITKTKYKGKVYCVEVPNHTIMVRNNGKATWSGNSHRGFKANGIIFDEYADQDPNNWSAVYEPMFTTTGGWAIFMGTPRGYNHFYDMIQDSKDSEDWFYQEATWRDSPYVNADQIALARRDAERKGTLSTFLQEYELEFRSVQGAVYPTFSRKIHVKKPSEFPDLDELTIYAGIDFGYHTTAIPFLGVDKDQNYWVFDEVYGKKETLNDIMPRIKQKLGDKRLVMMVGDSANRDAIEVMSKDFPMVPARKGAGSIIDGIDLIRNLLKPRLQLVGAPKPSIFFSTACKNLVREMESYKYPEDKKDRNPDEIPMKVDDHGPDALRYIILQIKHGVTVDNALPKAKMQYNGYGLM